MHLFKITFNSYYLTNIFTKNLKCPSKEAFRKFSFLSLQIIISVLKKKKLPNFRKKNSSSKLSIGLPLFTLMWICLLKSILVSLHQVTQNGPLKTDVGSKKDFFKQFKFISVYFWITIIKSSLNGNLSEIQTIYSCGLIIITSHYSY